MTLIRPFAWAAIAAVLTLAAGMAALALDEPPAPAAETPGVAGGHAHGHGAAGEAHDHDHGALQGAVDAGLAIQPQAGRRTTLVFTLTNEAGNPVEELMIHHARKLHVVIIGDGMQVIGHIHPQDFDEPIEDGRAKVHFTFPRPGRYLVAGDIMTEAGPYAEQFVVEVAGEAAEPRAGAGPAAAVAVVEAEEGDRYTAPVLLDGADRAQGYDVALAGPARIDAGEPATFTFRFARGGAPVTDLRPYLDAPLHLAVVKQGFGAFLHEHGAVAGEAQAGHEAHGSPASHDDAHGAHDHGHQTHGYQGPASFGPELTATVSFPEPGRYYLFAQAAHGDRLLVSRFPVQVE